MDFLALVLVGVLVGLTTVLFGFGGGFVTVPIITLVDADLGSDTARVAAATSALVMLVNAVVSTVSTKRETLAHLKGEWWLFLLLAAGGAFGAFCAKFAPEALLQWGFVVYIIITAVDLLVRPGFFRRGVARLVPAKTSVTAGAASPPCSDSRSAAWRPSSVSAAV